MNTKTYTPAEIRNMQRAEAARVVTRCGYDNIYRVRFESRRVEGVLDTETMNAVAQVVRQHGGLQVGQPYFSTKSFKYEIDFAFRDADVAKKAMVMAALHDIAGKPEKIEAKAKRAAGTARYDSVQNGLRGLLAGY